MVTTVSTTPSPAPDAPVGGPPRRSRGPILVAIIAIGLVAVLIAVGATVLAIDSGAGGNGTEGGTTTSTTADDTTADTSGTIDDEAAASDNVAATTESRLRYLIEEEKLAHDVYVTLGDLWGTRIFDNIARSETQHQNEVATVMTALGVADPRIDQVGVFADPSLQALYDRLVAQGSTSLQDAYEVGVAIEELDIADLNADLAVEDDPAVIAVMQNLLNGSTNHLAAFQRQL